MDSEHRHELKENDLAVAMTSLKDWWAKHQMKVLGTAVVLAALILAIRWFSQSASNTRDAEQYDLATAPTHEAYRALAQDTSNEAVKVHANLRGADSIIPMLRKPVGSGADQLTAEKKKQLMDQAAAMYKAVLEDTKHPLLRIKAHLGLAALAETRGDYDAAKKHYDDVQNQPGDGLDFLKKRAASFAAALPRIKVDPVYGREEEKSSKTDDAFKFPTLPLDPTKDGKDDETKDSKGGLLFPEITPSKDAKETPAKDAKAPETPAKDAKTPEPTPAKDAKEPATKDAKSPTP